MSTFGTITICYYLPFLGEVLAVFDGVGLEGVPEVEFFKAAVLVDVSFAIPIYLHIALSCSTV
jgi:hypothetical protein